MKIIAGIGNATLALCSATMLLVGGVTPACAQSGLDGFDPNPNGTVNVVVVQPDGKILIGGDFTTLSPNGGVAVARNRIARLNTDGTLDAGFDPNASGSVLSIALQADGRILIGGDFTTIGGQTRNRIARLDPTGLAEAFNPDADNVVLSIAVQADNKILVGGSFSGIGGQIRNRIARLDPMSGLADSFDPNANSNVSSIAVQADGMILVAGSFFNIGGQSRNGIARLDAVTGLADSFDPSPDITSVDSIAIQADGKILLGGTFSNMGGQLRHYIARLDPGTGLADAFNPNADEIVDSIVVQTDGKILVAGNFSNIGGQARHRISRLDPMTGLADSFDPNPNMFVNSIAVQADGKVLTAGLFTTFAPNGGAAVTRNHIARLETDGRLDRTLISGVDSVIYTTAIQPDGKTLIGGVFSNVSGVARNNIARLNTDGTVDTAFNPNGAGFVVWAIAVQTDGKILIGGAFDIVGGQPRRGIARLDPTTGLPDSWNPNANSGGVLSIAVQPDGKILVGGQFNGPNSIGGQMRNRIARLDATTGLADSFDPNANGQVQAIMLQSDGKILVGGEFSSIGGQARNYIARLDPNTGLADSLNPSANGVVDAIAVQSNGKVLVGGAFTSIGGQSRGRIARIDDATGLADWFNPSAGGLVDSVVISIVLQTDGKILAGGGFTSIGGQTRNSIARLDATTGLADSFNPDANNYVNTISLRADGKVLVGGQFTTIGGQTRDRLARLTNDTAALQNLVVTQTSINWTLGGSTPRFTNVAFEVSNDNVSYNSLGSGIPAGSNWTLMGLNIPTLQNLYVRARGRYRSGGLTRSDNITESVRNAFIPIPSPTPTPTPTLTPTPTPNLAATVNLPVATIDTAVTSFIEPVVTSAISTTDDLIGFQGDFTFDSSVVAFQSNPVTGGGLTAGNWNVSAIILSGAGSTRTLRISATSNDFTPLSGSGVLFNLNMTRVSSTPGATTALTWAAPPNNFFFFDSNFDSHTPTTTNGSITIQPTTITVSGTLSYCSNPVPGPVPGATLSLTGDAGGSTVSDGSGNYTLLSVPSGGNYTVTPSKAALTPGFTGINTIDVIATQRHFLNLGAPLSGCRLTAADVNGVGGINTVDVIAIQRFFLVLSTGIANVGKYQFAPVNRTYSGVTVDQTNQNYDTIVFGDVAATYVH